MYKKLNSILLFKMSELIDACYNSNTKFALKLIENKANIDLQDENGYSALIWSCWNNNIELISYLLEMY